MHTHCVGVRYIYLSIAYSACNQNYVIVITAVYGYSSKHWQHFESENRIL